MRLALSVLLYVVLSACSAISPTNAVRDEKTAIQIAKTLFGEEYANRKFWKGFPAPIGWHARLIKGTWVAWYGPNYPNVTLDSSQDVSCYIAERDGSHYCVICAT